MATVTITITDQPEIEGQEIGVSMEFTPELFPEDDATPAQAMAIDILDFISKRSGDE